MNVSMCTVFDGYTLVTNQSASQQVFITENAQEIIPEFLTLLQGPIDCPDFPLNVSRSYLQNDPYVQRQLELWRVFDRYNDFFL